MDYKFPLTVAVALLGVCAPGMAEATTPHVPLYGYSLYNKAIETHGYIATFLDTPEKNTLLAPCCESKNIGVCAAGAVDGVIYGFEYDLPDDNGPVHTDIVSYDVVFGTKKIVGSWADKKWNNLYPMDMSYDYTSGKMYLLAYEYGNALYTVDLETAAIEKVVDLTPDAFAMAVSPKGEIYIITSDGWLSTLNKSTGAVVPVKRMEYNNLYGRQDMEFDRTSGKLYWAMRCSDYDQADNSWLVEVDLSDPSDIKETIVGSIGFNANFIGMYIPYASSLQAPGAPSDIAFSHGENNPFEITISWKNPTSTFEGGTLDSINGVALFRDGKQVKTFSNVTPGEQMSFTEVVDGDAGLRKYEVVAFNMQGDGQRGIARIYAGYDAPAAAGNLVAKVSDNLSSITVTWDAPTIGHNGGAIKKDEVKYRVKRLPDNLVLYEDIKERSFTDENFRRVLCYSYEITAYNEEGETAAVSAQYVAGPGKEVPFSESFYDKYDFLNMWTALDANKDRHSWIFYSGMGNSIFGDFESAVEYMLSVYDATPGLDRSDDWLISPPLSFEPGKKYELRVMARSLNNENIELAVGPGTNPDLMKVVGEYELESFMSDKEADDKGYHTFLVEIPTEGLEKGCVGIHLTTPIDAQPSAFMQIHQVDVAESGTLGIDDTVADDLLTVSGANGRIIVNGEYDSASVYDIDGRHLGGIDGSFAPGIYVVTVKSGTVMRHFKIKL